MKEFDYEQYRVVGFVEDKYNSNGNASIDVIGYSDDLYVFHPLSRAEVIEWFPTRGKVFAYKFNQNYEHLKGTIVCLSVQPSNSDGKENFVWDWDQDVKEYGEIVYPLEDQFSDNGQQNYDILLNNDLINIDYEELVYCAGRVYLLIPNNNDNIIKYWEASSLNIVTINDKKYVVGNSLPKHDGQIDITNDEQLINWYLTKIVKKNWVNIKLGQSFRNSESFLREYLSSLKNLDESTLQNRLNRLKTINTNLSISFESLKEIAETPWFSDVIKRSIAKEKIQLLEHIKKENDLELKRIKKDYDVELLHLKEEQDIEIKNLRQRAENILYDFSEQERTMKVKLQEKNLEIELLDKTAKEKQQAIATLEESITNLNDRKTSIIRDFTIIREVLNAGGKPVLPAITESNKQFSLEVVNFSDKPIIRFQAYVKSLENIMKANGAQKFSPLTMGKMLAKDNVVLYPSTSIAQSLNAASHKCMYLTEYVSAKWASFDDLWNNGLSYIISQCAMKQDIMHFLLLQNINISYLPNYLQPLADMQRGIISKFPTLDVTFPNNLRILCTVAEDKLIQMPASILRHFGCIDKAFQFESPNRMQFANDSNLGYLSSEELLHEREQEPEIQNMFDQYTDE